MVTEEIPPGNNNIQISYTYGYTTLPTQIRTLACCLAGIRAWVNFMGGSYNYLNSYSIPQQSVNKGDFYDRAQKNIEALTNEANGLLDRVGRKPRTLFVSSGRDK